MNQDQTTLSQLWEEHVKPEFATHDLIDGNKPRVASVASAR